MKIVEKRM